MNKIFKDVTNELITKFKIIHDYPKGSEITVQRSSEISIRYGKCKTHM